MVGSNWFNTSKILLFTSFELFSNFLSVEIAQVLLAVCELCGPLKSEFPYWYQSINNKNQLQHILSNIHQWKWMIIMTFHIYATWIPTIRLRVNASLTVMCLIPYAIHVNHWPAHLYHLLNHVFLEYPYHLRLNRFL